MRYAVLGSSGQIGAPLCKYLKSQKEDFIEIDIEREGVLEDLRTLIDQNMTPDERRCHWTSLLDEVDFVFFLAFDVGGSRYLNKYQHTTEFLSNNVKIMDNVFSYLKTRKIPFIFASSQMSNMIHSPYGIAKALGEAYTKSLNGITVKFWNVYGPELDNRKTHVISDFILKALKNSDIEMLTDGSEERQFLFAEDCAECLYTLSLEYDSLPRDKNYHITSFEWVSVKEIANIIQKQLRPRSPSRVICANATDNVQQGIRNEPDPYIVKYWRPTTSIEDGIRKMIEFYTKGEGKHVTLEK